MTGRVQRGRRGKAVSQDNKLSPARCFALVAHQRVPNSGSLQSELLADLHVSDLECHASPFGFSERIAATTSSTASTSLP